MHGAEAPGALRLFGFRSSVYSACCYRWPRWTASRDARVGCSQAAATGAAVTCCCGFDVYTIRKVVDVLSGVRLHGKCGQRRGAQRLCSAAGLPPAAATSVRAFTIRQLSCCAQHSRPAQAQACLQAGNCCMWLCWQRQWLDWWHRTGALRYSAAVGSSDCRIWGLFYQQLCVLTHVAVCAVLTE